MRRFIIPSLLLALTACGGGGPSEAETKQAKTQLGSKPVTIISGSITGGSALSGSGMVLFAEDHGSYKSGASYALDFTLPDGASLTLVSHSNASLESGWELEFRREGSGPGSLKSRIKAKGEIRDTDRSDGVNSFAGIDASQPIRLQVDVHNNESHALVWNRNISEDFQKEAAILNTEENDNSPGNGSGTRWGLKLEGASVTRADASAPKFLE